MNKKQTRKSRPLLTRIRHHARLAVIPHRDNQYRPHAIRRSGIGFVLAVVVSTQLLSAFFSSSNVLGEQAQITADGLLLSSNQARKQAGLTSLTLNPQLNQAAYAKAQDMFKNQYWAHTSPAGAQPWQWITSAHYNYSQAGENLAKGFTTNSSVMSAWLASSSHRANVLGKSYQDVGFAVVTGELKSHPTTLVVAMYGVPADTSAMVAGTTTFNEAVSGQGFIASIGQKVQTLPPLVIGNILLLTFVSAIALLAHAYRRKLPKQLQVSWYHHHGAYKAAGLMSVSVIMVIIYSGGQI